MTNPVAQKSSNNDDILVDKKIAEYLNIGTPENFFLYAGAGSGKTRSLVNALKHIRDNYEQNFNLLGCQVGVITYTNAACEEIKRRIEYHPIFHVSTIHSFAWELIKGFDRDISKWLQKNLKEEILKLKDKEASGKEGSDASVERNAKIESKSNRLKRLETIGTFVYNPNGENFESNSLNHEEVISICTEFLMNKNLMGWILVSRFPFLLIDESQDTKKNLMDAFLCVSKKHRERFSIGLIGDVMQRIYFDGKERIAEELPDYWAKPIKSQNYRCPKRVIKLINKIREQVDTHIQIPKNNAPEGVVRMFIRSKSENGHNDIENSIRQIMAKEAKDPKWNEQDQFKTLTLEHHMSAKRLGFNNLYEPLNEVQNFKTGLRDGTLPALRLFSHFVLPLFEARDDRFLTAQIMRASSPKLSPIVLKEASDPITHLKTTLSGVESMMELWKKGEPSCENVLLCVEQHGLFEIHDTLKPVVKILKARKTSSSKEADDDPISKEVTALLKFLEAPFGQVKKYKEYILGDTSFDTHQGVKGLEFDRVMLILDDFGARGRQFQYGKILGDKELSETDKKNIKEGKENSLDRIRRLLYVTCSRAKSSLAIVAYAENPVAVKETVINNGWFDESEVDLLI